MILDPFQYKEKLVLSWLTRQCLVLDTDLHLVLLVTPIYVTLTPVWSSLLDVYEKLTAPQKRVAGLAGVTEAFLVKAVRGIVNVKVNLKFFKLCNIKLS